jgi:hypothetical protein
MDVPLELFLKKTMVPIFCCAINVKKGVGGLECIFRDQIKGSDERV